MFQMLIKFKILPKKRKIIIWIEMASLKSKDGVEP